MSTNLIASLSNVTHYFSLKKVLGDFSIEFKENKITSLLGFSGSGKSTVLKMINGMIKPNQGTVEVFGSPFSYDNPNQIRLKIGYAVQSVGLFPHLTIQQNISLLGTISKQNTNEVNKRVNHLIDMVELPQSYLQKYPNQLSGGEQQRVGLCRAFYLKPPLILMDEPFASLDYKTRSSIYGQLLLMQKTENSTVIIVTHQLEEAIYLSDDFIWLNDGKVYKQGDKEYLRNIQHEFKEQYV